MLKALLALQAHIQGHGQPPVTVYGICYNLQYCGLDETGYSQLLDLFEVLDLNRYEPIPHYQLHKSKGELWVGEQRELRLALIEKLITYYQEQENGMAV